MSNSFEIRTNSRQEFNALKHDADSVYGLKLTRREFDVLIKIVDGYSNQEIAEQLCISHHTVITHRKHLIEKFQARNTAQMVKNACRIFAFE